MSAVEGERGDMYLTVRQVDERLGVGRTSIYDWVRRGLFPKQVKIFRASRWRERDIEKWLAEQPRGAYGEVKP